MTRAEQAKASETQGLTGGSGPPRAPTAGPLCERGSRRPTGPSAAPSNWSTQRSARAPCTPLPTWSRGHQEAEARGPRAAASPTQPAGRPLPASANHWWPFTHGHRTRVPGRDSSAGPYRTLSGAQGLLPTPAEATGMEVCRHGSDTARGHVPHCSLGSSWGSRTQAWWQSSFLGCSSGEGQGTGTGMG